MENGVSEQLSRVADVQLAFNNAKLLHKLAARGVQLKKGDFDKAKEIEDELTELKNEDLKDPKTSQFMRPNTFYITFKYEDTLVKAIQDLKEIELYGEKISLKRAREPTDILWENRHITKGRRFLNAALVIIVMVAVLLGFFLLATWALQQKLVIKYYHKPPGVNCDSVIRNYGYEEDLSDESIIGGTQTWAEFKVQAMEPGFKESA